MKRKNPLLIGTAILTVTGLLSRFIGFFYRIFLSKVFGAEDMAKGFAEAIMEEGITPKNNRVDTVEKYKKLTKEIMDLHDTNKKAQKDLKTSVLRETEFIKTLNRKKGSTDSENRFI